MQTESFNKLAGDMHFNIWDKPQNFVALQCKKHLFPPWLILIFYRILFSKSHCNSKIAEAQVD